MHVENNLWAFVNNGRMREDIANHAEVGTLLYSCDGPTTTEGLDADGEAVIMLAFQASGRGSTPLQCKLPNEY